MKKMMKLIVLLIIIIPIVNIKALEVSNTDIKVEAGKTKNIELYANSEVNIKSVIFTLTFSTYDMPAYYSPGTGVNDTTPNSITHNVNLSEVKSGKIYLGDVVVSVKQYPTDTYGNVVINNAKAITENDEEITLNATSINISIGKEEIKPVDKNMLDKIESKIVNIELKKDVFEYEVTIKEDITELDLKPIAKEENTNIDISSQKIEKDKNNEIIITTKNGNTEQKYTIKINIEKEKVLTVTPTTKEESINNNSSNNYKSKWIIFSIIFALIIIIGLIFNKKK